MNYIQIKDIPHQIIDGDRGKNYPNKNELTKRGFCLFLNNKNFFNNKFIDQDSYYISEFKHNQLSNGALNFNDIVLTTRGTIGNVLYIDETIPFPCRINSGMVIIRKLENFLNKFIYYFLISNFCQQQIKSLQSGAAQPQLPIKDIILLKIPYLTIDKQKHIVNTI